MTSLLRYTLFCWLLSLPATAQTADLAGTWQGQLNAGGQTIPLVVHLTRGADGHRGTLDSPRQNAYGLPIADVITEGDNLTLVLTALGARYVGRRVTPDSLTGTWQQGGAALPLHLKRTDAAPTGRLRPQEPVPPFPYRADEVTVPHPSGHFALAGTLTMPEGAGPFPAVVLVSGSGPQDRDETMLGHKPFAVLADYLTRRGVAVLRYDDRGQGASGGDFATATTTDFATDAAAAFTFLKAQPGVDPARTGIAGHSEGGIVGPLVASQDPTVGFLVLLAAPGVPGNEVLVEQFRQINAALGIGPAAIEQQLQLNRRWFELLGSDATTTELRAQMDALITAEVRTRAGGDTATQAALQRQLTDNFVPTLSPWFRQFVRLDPRPVLSRVKCPVLALNGAKDLQVRAGVNLAAIATALREGGNRHVTTQTLPALNHLFQTAETGLPDEYERLEETFAPLALQIVADWIGRQTAN